MHQRQPVGRHLLANVRKTLVPEFISMNAMMAAVMSFS
jgi:hypothetical protein